MIEQPFVIDNNGDIKNTTDEIEVINARIAQVVMTLGYYENNIGELPWDIYFGSGLPLLRHARSRETIINQLSYYITQALKKYMPELIEVYVDSDLYTDPVTKGNLVQVTIYWKNNNKSGNVTTEVML